MDIYHRAAAWATAVVMESELINDAAYYMEKHVKSETVKSLVSLALLVVPVIGDHFDIGIINEFDEFTNDPSVGDQVEAAIHNAIDLTAEITAQLRWQKDDRVLESLAADILEADIVASEILETQIREAEALEAETLEAGIRADAEKAAAAIEELTVQLANVTSEQAREAEQETAALEAKFKSEQDELVSKLDGMRDKYFKNHPDLDKDQRADAEQTFKTIKDDATGALKAQQDSRLMELQAQQQDLRDNYEQARKELDETRDERA
jgi:hypothetical protein